MKNPTKDKPIKKAGNTFFVEDRGDMVNLSDETPDRITRGGSWYDDAKDAPFLWRAAESPLTLDPHFPNFDTPFALGFRICRNIPKNRRRE